MPRWTMVGIINEMNENELDYQDEQDVLPAFRVLSIGDLVTDVMLAIPRLPVQAEENQIVQSVQLEPGGAGNFLIAGARLGLRMAALGVVGADDPFGAAALNALLYEGVDVHRVVRQRGGTTTIVFVLADERAEHVFLGQNGTGEVIPFSGEWQEAVLQADALQLWGYTLNEERIAAASLDALRFGRAQQRTVFFDPGPFMARLPEDIWKETLRHTDVVLLTADEIPAFAGEPGNWQSGGGLLDFGASMVCVKRGGQGCVIFTADEVVQHGGYAVTVRDTTAAGDAFAAGFIYAWLHKFSLAQTAAFANAVGAAKVQKFGSGRQVPTRDEVREVLQTYDATLAATMGG